MCTLLRVVIAERFPACFTPTLLDETEMQQQLFLLHNTCEVPAALLQGATAVSAYVTHGVFPNQSWQRFTSAANTPDAFHSFWITDSCPRSVGAVQGQSPFQVSILLRPLRTALPSLLQPWYPHKSSKLALPLAGHQPG